MASKGNILIVSQDGEMPDRLTGALDHLGLTGRSCRPEEVLKEKRALAEVGAAVVSLEKLADLEKQSVGHFMRLMDAWSIECLVLAKEITRKAAGDAKWGHVMCAGWDESVEMLKGRLATLLKMGSKDPPMAEARRRQAERDEALNHSLEEVTEEMRLAARVQEDFLPKDLPGMAGVGFGTVYRPASWLSGDIYDIMRLDESHVGFYVVDAVGHGMPAALLTMFIKRALVTKRIEGHEYQIIEPGEALSQLNTEMVEQKLSNHPFATACYGILNIHTLGVRLANAGHPAALLIGSDGEIKELQAEGSLLGVFEDADYATVEFGLQQGDKMVLYSDGVEDVIVETNGGESTRFREGFVDLARGDAQSLCDGLLEAIDGPQDSRRVRDDATVVAVEILGRD